MVGKMGVRTRVGEEVIKARPFADRRDDGAGPAFPSSAGGSLREMVPRRGASVQAERACKRSEGHPMKVVGRAQYWSEHPVKWVEVDEGEAKHPVKTVGYARQGERPVKVVDRSCPSGGSEETNNK